MRIVILAIVLHGLLAIPAQASEQLTLKDAISMAMEKNGLVRAAGYNLAAARQGSAQVASRYYPGLFFEESWAVSNSPTQTFMMKLDEGRFAQNDFQISRLNHPGSWSDFKTALTVQQPLYLPTQAPARNIARLETEISQHGLDAVREDVAFRVFTQYLEVRKAKARVKAMESSLAKAAENQRLAEVHTANGVGLKSDELRARTYRMQVEQQLVTARNDLTLAGMQLALQIGLSSDRTVELSSEPVRIAVPELNDTSISSVLRDRSDLRQARSELDKAAEQVGLARSWYLPTVGAVASYQLNARDVPFAADNDAWMASVKLSWELFDGFRRGSGYDRAVAERSARSEVLETKGREAAFQIKESYLRHEEMGRRLEVARLSVQDAEETVRLLTRRFENSLATMLELLDAEEALSRARLDLAESEAGIELAVGRIHYVSGSFAKEIMK